MKAVILAGGFGTRISEESGVRPKPMVEIGGKPLIWHIMKIYHTQGINDFVILCGYKGHMIKEYFANYKSHNSDMTFDFIKNEVVYHKNNTEKWRVTLVDTGEDAMTGGRILRAKDYIGNERFLLTYGDGLSNIEIKKLIASHESHKGALVTVTAVPSPGRFGAFTLKSDQTAVTNFREKPSGDGVEEAWISGGYFVMEPEIFDYIEDGQTVWEEKPMQTLAHEGKLHAYRHEGFWHPIDTLRDKNVIEKMWASSKAPWKIW
ncbi:glucose-1-phosphate cytidylyltransferase [Candidatus Microgenomates bacterium]|nr:glucose-1-phosphate cytidylyltransferase [Candidatus Microgenomates bacterium]